VKGKCADCGRRAPLVLVFGSAGEKHVCLGCRYKNYDENGQQRQGGDR
jgi:hypothetical protein